MRKPSLNVVVFLLVMLGCSDAADDSLPEAADASSPQAEPSAQQDSESNPSRTGRPACGITARTTITANGIGRLRIGASVAELRAECDVVRDRTARGAEGMPERRVAVDLRRDTVEAVMVDGRVWRIHVDGPAFRTADGFGVGSPVTDLREGREARVLAGEGAMFLTLVDRCGLSFRLEGVPFGRERPAADLPPGARVAEVLVFGCGSPRP